MDENGIRLATGLLENADGGMSGAELDRLLGSIVIENYERENAFSEADAFFWLALALATGWLRPVAYVYGIGLAAGSLWILFRRLVRAAQIDAWLRSKV